MKRIQFIVNPISGTKSKKNILAMIPKEINHELYDITITHTEYAGHAEELARRAAQEGMDIVCAVGGDGTVNEVARGLIGTDTALAIIPCGSGNGLARHAGISMKPKKAIAILNEGHTEVIDYGLINDRPFFCTCGVGYDAEVSESFARAGRRGMTTYMKTCIQVGTKYKGEDYELTFDNGQVINVHAWLVACCNASQYGNDAFIAPTASICDGWMDVVIMSMFPIYRSPMVGLHLRMNNINKTNYVNIIRCKSISIKRKGEGHIHLDGDPSTAGCEVNVKLVPKGLKMVVNGTDSKTQL